MDIILRSTCIFKLYSKMNSEEILLLSRRMQSLTANITEKGIKHSGTVCMSIISVILRHFLSKRSFIILYSELMHFALIFSMSGID